VRENVVPQLFEPRRPWQRPCSRPRATTGRALRVVVRRNERTRQPFVGRNDGGSRGERCEEARFEHSGNCLRGPSIRALPRNDRGSCCLEFTRYGESVAVAVLSGVARRVDGDEHRLDRCVSTESGHDRIAHQLGQLRVQPFRKPLVFTAPVIVAHMRPHAFDHVRLLVQGAQDRRCTTALTPLRRLRFLGCRVVAIEKLAAPALFHVFSLLVSGEPLQRSPWDAVARLVDDIAELQDAHR